MPHAALVTIQISFLAFWPVCQKSNKVVFHVAMISNVEIIVLANQPIHTQDKTCISEMKI